MKKLTVTNASDILKYSSEEINPTLNFDVMLDFSVFVKCMLKA